MAAVADAFEVAPLLKAVQKAAVPVVASALIASSNAGAALAADSSKGSGVFEGNCAACHAGGQNVIMPDKTLEKEVRVHAYPFLHTDFRMPMPFISEHGGLIFPNGPCRRCAHETLDYWCVCVARRLSSSTSTAASARQR